MEKFEDLYKVFETAKQGTFKVDLDVPKRTLIGIFKNEAYSGITIRFFEALKNKYSFRSQEEFERLMYYTLTNQNVNSMISRFLQEKGVEYTDAVEAYKFFCKIATNMIFENPSDYGFSISDCFGYIHIHRSRSIASFTDLKSSGNIGDEYLTN